MDAIGKQFHMRGSVYPVRHQGELAYMLPLIERVRERSFEARIEAIFASAAAVAWVEQHRPLLRAGATLLDLHLADIRPRGEVLSGVVMNLPTIAPPRQAVPSPAHPSQVSPA